VWLVGGVVIGTGIGWFGHAKFMKRYLKRHMKDHPEYKMYLDIITGNAVTGK